MQRTPYQMSEQELLDRLSSHGEQGLSEEEAQKRLRENGLNRLTEGRKKTVIQQFFSQFKDLMILILLAAAGVSFVIAFMEKEGYFEPILILLIVVLNAIIGTVQEGKAERALEALKKMSAPKARVIRKGEERVIDASELVPGDLIFLEAGDFVPADGRILQSSSLKTEESALTGESEPEEKQAGILEEGNIPLGDRTNMIYSGCSVTYGTAKAVITATGMDTEIGKIARLIAGAEDTGTPLQHKLEQLGRWIGLLAVGVCIVIFILGLLDGMEIVEIFMIAVALAVSAIPEGLPAIVTVVLALGVQKMVRKNAIIRKLPAVETLGSTSVICSDKTGTLTQNRMTLTQVYVAAANTLEKTEGPLSAQALELLRWGALCSEGKIGAAETGEPVPIGDPTETSILMEGEKRGIRKSEAMEQYPRLGTLPFDSDRKMMASIHRDPDGRILVIVKGAFDEMAARCAAGNLEGGRQANGDMGGRALRVLAVGVRYIDEYRPEMTSEDLETELTFLGLLGMIDPPRPEAAAAVALCREAGIRPVMITGDHVLTASAIANELGILKEGDRAISGMELSALSEEELVTQVEEISVYARVSPEDKIRIIQAWQKRGAVVSMTGDGVNDAPALKAADIGCAMGITGTDVAKGASDMILSDDNFATIVDAVREGRGIYENIRHTVGFLLGTNIGEVLIVLAAMVLWKVSPFLAIHLLWINLITDSLPAIALGMEPVRDDVMTQKPKPKEEGIFANGYGLRIVLQGLMFALLTLCGFALAWSHTGELEGARTLAFMVLALSQTFHAFNMRSSLSLRMTGVFTNRILNGAVLLSLALVALVLFVPPVCTAFGLTALPASLYGIGLALALVPVLVLEIYKNTAGKKACGRRAIRPEQEKEQRKDYPS